MSFQIPADWKWCPSPNHSPRNAPVTAIVLHCDAASNAAGSLDWIRKSQAELDAIWEKTPASKRPPQKYKAVSYHVLVDRDGTVYAVVNPDRKAWHAGVSVFQGQNDCNRYAVGVSMANRNDGEAYPEAQLAAVADVCALLCQYYAIPVIRITTHAIVAPTRKTDPKGLDLLAFQERVGGLL